MNSTIYCGECGQRLSDGARFCDKCGTAAPVMPGAAARDKRPEDTGRKAGNGWQRWILGGLAGLFMILLMVLGWSLGRSLAGGLAAGALTALDGDEEQAVVAPTEGSAGGEVVEATPGNDGAPAGVIATSTVEAPVDAPTMTPSPTAAPTATATPSPTPTSTATATPAAQAVFSDVYFCEQPCNADGSNASTVFAGGTDIIYVRWRYENVPTGARYQRIWESNGQEWAHYDCTWPGPSSAVESISLSDPGGLRSGEWKVTILLDGEMVMQETITLTGSVTHWDVAGEFDSCYGKR